MGNRGDVLALVVATNRREPRKRVPDPGRVRALLVALAEDFAVLAAVRLVALEDVVAPRDVVLLHQVREVGPRVMRPPAGLVLGLTRWHARVLDRVHAGLRAVVPAARRPGRHREEV